MPKKLDKTIRLMPEKAQDVLHNLILDIKKSGPVQPKYHNYCKLGENTYHCHLLYKWVAVWRCEKINNPDASVWAQCSMFRTVCSHKVVAVGFNTLRYDASVGVLNPPHESTHSGGQICWQS